MKWYQSRNVNTIYPPLKRALAIVIADLYAPRNLSKIQCLCWSLLTAANRMLELWYGSCTYSVQWLIAFKSSEMKSIQIQCDANFCVAFKIGKRCPTTWFIILFMTVLQSKSWFQGGYSHRLMSKSEEKRVFTLMSLCVSLFKTTVLSMKYSTVNMWWFGSLYDVF